MKNMMVNEEKKKYHAVIEVNSLQLSSDYYEHVSSAIDDVLRKAKDYLKSQGYEGKFLAEVSVYVKEEDAERLIQTVRTKIIVE
jgi:hypothetical protein